MMTRMMGMVALVTVTGGSAVAAPAAPAAAAPVAAEKTGAVQADVLGVLADVEKKIVSLEEAVPQNKFDWRPAPGVRSIAEAYLHIAFANYNLTRMATGKTPPADTGITQDRGKWDSQTTDKAKIKAILEKSFAFVHEGIKGLSDADLDRKVDFFGHPMTARAVLMVLVGHDNEHLGQSVAYARANKIVPPWSEGKK
ncbi:MAG TPA: DinB family protein [Polyangia bacterium]|nr:DinB family protein [Polyangia bacterium]